MTGVVKKITNPGSVAMVEAIDGGRILGNIPKMRVVQP
jgi:hypothetical protein